MNEAAGKPPIKNLRWYILSLLFLSTGLNYLDRQTLSVLATTIQQDLGMTKGDYANINTTFLITYTIMYAVAGRIVDRVGTRKGLLWFVSGWSVANMLHGFARSTLQLGIFRGMLGATEAANFPACVKGVSEWFPVRERALAIGIVNAGVAAGGVLSLPLVSYTALAFGWRAAFVLTGSLGLVWVVAWHLLFRTPAEHKRLGEAERALILESGTPALQLPAGGKPTQVPVRQLLRMREAWACILARVFTDPVTYFLMFWIPMYLQEERGFTLKDIAAFAWIPFAAFAFGSVMGGVIPRWLISRGVTLNRARKGVMLTVSCTIPVLCFFITRVASPGLALALLSVMMFGHAAWSNITLPAELFPGKVVGVMTGLGGACGGLMGAISQQAIGRAATSGSYATIFLGAGAFYILAYTAVHFLAPDLGRIRTLETKAG